MGERTNRLIICQSISCQLIFGPNHEIPTSPPLNGNKYKSNSPFLPRPLRCPVPPISLSFRTEQVYRPLCPIRDAPCRRNHAYTHSRKFSPAIRGRKLYLPPNQIDISFSPRVWYIRVVRMSQLFQRMGDIET